MYAVTAANTAGLEKNLPAALFGNNNCDVKQNATRILVRMVKKLKNLMIVSSIEATRFSIMR